MKVLLGLVVVLLVLVAAAWLKLRRADVPYAEIEAKYAQPDSAYVDLPDGVRVHYRAAGDAARPLVVLVHGYGDSFASWEGWIRELAPRFRVIALDLPGHGLTRAPEAWAPSTDAYVATLEAFATALGLPRFALAGNSMGGGVAWAYALAHPERLRALALVDAAGWPLQASGPPPLAFRILQYPFGRWLLAKIDNRPLIAEGLKKDVYDPTLITDAFVDRWAAFQLAPGHRPILMAIPVSPFARATGEALARISTPTLVMHGEADAIIPVDHGHRFASAIRGAKLIVYPKVGHLPQVEIPQRSAADFAAFVEALPVE